MVGSAAAQEMLAAGLSVMPSSWCGRERGDWHGSFNKQGLMGYVSKRRSCWLACWLCLHRSGVVVQCSVPVVYAAATKQRCGEGTALEKS